MGMYNATQVRPGLVDGTMDLAFLGRRQSLTTHAVAALNVDQHQVVRRHRRIIDAGGRYKQAIAIACAHIAPGPHKVAHADTLQACGHNPLSQLQGIIHYAHLRYPRATHTGSR